MGLTTFLPLGGVLAVTVAARAVPWRRLPPRVTLWTLSVVAAVGALTAVLATAVLAGGFALGTPSGQWLIEACSLFAGHHRVPVTVGVVASAALVAQAWRIGSTLASVRSGRVVCDGPLTVLEAAEPLAFARSGRRGGVVVSTGMLAALAPAERRVLFAHERAHVRARHDLHLLVHRLATAALPWLDPLGGDVALATERVADAVALREVAGDRPLVARAIARAALAADRHGSTPPALAFNGGAVSHRVQSVLHPTRGAAAPASAIGMVGLLGVGAAGVFVHHLAALIEHICLS